LPELALRGEKGGKKSEYSSNPIKRWGTVPRENGSLIPIDSGEIEANFLVF